jgi:hypothetical protein
MDTVQYLRKEPNMKERKRLLIKIVLFNILIFCLLLPSTFIIFYEPIVIKKYFNNLMAGGTEMFEMNSTLAVSLFFIFDFAIKAGSIYVLTYVSKRIYFLSMNFHLILTRKQKNIS